MLIAATDLISNETKEEDTRESIASSPNEEMAETETAHEEMEWSTHVT
jgi:hypothetical protein